MIIVSYIFINHYNHYHVVLYFSSKGVSHGAFDNDIVALHAMRKLFEYLPLNNTEKPPRRFTVDTPERSEESLRWVYVCDDDDDDDNDDDNDDNKVLFISLFV